MGKPRRGHRRAKRPAQQPPGANGANNSNSNNQGFTAAQYVGKAEDMLTQGEYELAAQFLQRALEVDNNDTDAMDLFGEVLVELGQLEQAAQVLLRSVELAPESGYSKRLHLGQLLTFPQSVHHIHKGIALLSAEIARLQGAPGANSTDVAALRTKLAAAHCSVAEIYMSDACFEPNAESECEKHALAAIATEPNIEAHTTMANLRLSQCRNDDAKTHLTNALQVLAAMPEDELPAFEIRFSLAKMLVECDMLSEAQEVVEVLLVEDDENSELWYVAGVIACAEGNKENALTSLETSRKLVVKQGGNDETVAVVDAKLEEVRAMPDKEMSDGDEEDEEDDDEDEDDEGDEEEEGDDDQDMS